LDAPELQDDFYLNLVDWSSQNMLSVGLNTCVYLWSACNSQVIKLCDLGNENSESVTSVQWSERGDLLAVGTHKGILQVFLDLKFFYNFPSLKIFPENFSKHLKKFKKFFET